MESIHSNFVISRNHWPALTVWGDKTNLISQILSLFYHHTSPQDVHPRIRSTGQSASQQHLHHIRLMWCWQHTYHSARRGTVCGEWHLTLPLRKGYCSADPIYRNWPTKTMPAAKLLNSLPRRKYAMIVSHNINLIVPLISCVTLLLNLVAQIWKINLKYPGSPQPTHRHSDCETTTTNRQKEYRFRLPRAIISESVRGKVTLCNSQGGCWHRWRDSSKLTELGASGYSTRVIMVSFVNFALEWWR